MIPEENLVCFVYAYLITDLFPRPGEFDAHRMKIKGAYFTWSQQNVTQIKISLVIWNAD